MYSLAISALPFMILIVACAIASVMDIRFRRIPHVIPILVAACAIPIQLMHGLITTGESLLIGLIVLFLGTFLFAIGWMGGGDIKLLAAGAMLLGPSQAFNFIFYSLIAGGALGIITLILRKQIVPVIMSLFERLRQSSSNPSVLLQAPSGIALPYALAIAAGAIACTASSFIPVAMRIT